MIRTSFFICVDALDTIRKLGARLGMTPSEIIRAAISDFIAKHK